MLVPLMVMKMLMRRGLHDKASAFGGKQGLFHLHSQVPTVLRLMTHRGGLRAAPAATGPAAAIAPASAVAVHQLLQRATMTVSTMRQNRPQTSAQSSPQQRCDARASVVVILAACELSVEIQVSPAPVVE